MHGTAIDVRVSFLDWMFIGVPALLSFLPLAGFLNTFVPFGSLMTEAPATFAAAETQGHRSSNPVAAR